jgi:hypothetical protein
MTKVRGFECKAYNICRSMGNDRGTCQTIPNTSLDDISLEERVNDISGQLANMQACLSSIVLLLSEANQKET